MTYTRLQNELKNKKLYIFDMDGTIYLGGKVFDFAVRFIKNLRQSGRRVLFFTNNASHNKRFYAEKLSKMGFEADTNEIMTSGDVTIEFLNRHRKGKKVYLVGTEQLEESFREAGIGLYDREDADIVVTSFDTALTYEKMSHACRAVMNGAEYLSTHPDFNCPTEDGFIPDSGAISAFVTASTGVTPRYFGKPYEDTVNMIGEYTGVERKDMCIFGDRLYTDIALGVHHGVMSVCVLTGETTKEMIESANECDRPDIVFDSLNDADLCIFGDEV